MTRLEAVIFDWAGTTVDFGSMAPVRAITKLFKTRGIELSDAEVRRDMGLFKEDHIRRILGFPQVMEAWQALNERAANEQDVETLLADFATVQMEALEHHSELIGGVAPLAARLRGRGLKIGSTTGYTRQMLDRLVARAGEQGYRPDLSYCPDDVGGGRPKPWMCLRLALEFRLSSSAAAVKVGDTPNDIAEGLNAGMWTVGVAVTGNEMGLSQSELQALSPEGHKSRRARACVRLRGAGAHYLVDGVDELEPIVDEIDGRLAAGQRP